MNILVVDDNPTNRKLLRAQLEAENIAVVEAADGIDALAKLEQGQVDGIVSDILMPRMDGYRLCRDVRSDPRHAATPFIFYTATYTSPGDEKFSLELGADKFLRKPAPVARILEALQCARETVRVPKPEPPPPELHLLTEYNERLVAKLEEKNISLEQAVGQLRLQAIALETAANSILITDAQGVIIWINPAFSLLTGYPPEEALGRTPRILKSDKHEPAFYRDFWETILSGMTWKGEFINRRRNGELYCDEHTITPAKDAAGDITHFIGVMNDVTPRKRAETILRQSEERLRLVTENARVGLVLVDREHRYIYANSSYAQILDLPPSNLAGRAVADVLGDVYQKQIQPRLAEAFRGKRVSYELRRAGAGAEKTLAVTYEPIQDGEGICHVLAVVTDITERQRAENSLRLFRTLIDRSNDGFEVIDAETGRFLDVNERNCEAHGYTRQEMLSLNVTEVEVASVSQSTWASLVDEIRQQGSKTIEGRHRRKDGTIFPVEVNVKCVQLDREYLIAVVRDVTERQRAEAAIRESEKRFRELAETIQEVFWVTDPAKNRMLYVSPAYETIWGRTCQSLYDAPQSWIEAVHPEDREQALQAMLEKQAAGTYDEEYRIVQPDGSLRWIRDRAFPVRNGDGAAERIVGVARDITRRQLAVMALRESERMLERAQHVARIGSWVSEPRLDGKLEWSAETCRIFGFRPEEFDGRVETFLSLVHPGDREHVKRTALEALADGKAYDLEHRIVRRDGQIRWVREQADIERDEAGQPVRLIGVAHDITEKRQLEEQLRQSQKMEAIGQLAGGVAHDFNNILAATMMQAELLLDEPLPERVREGLSHIRAYSERAANLTRQLLLFSRKQVMQPRDLDLNEIVSNLARMLQRMINENVRLQLSLHPTPLLTHADAGMLDQILMNLAVNARDAMPEGGRLLIETSEKIVDENMVRLWPDAAPGRYVSLGVSDTGSGISPEILPRIFEPFFTTKEPGKGTGLGLATVFGIVKQHRGWIKVYSEPGLGANFQVFLPACARKPPSASSADSAKKTAGGTETILLVEDDKPVRALTRALLEKQGYRVLEASNGAEACELWSAAKDQVQLLLTDLVMPGGISGQQLAQRLQKDKPRLKTIFTSGYSAELAGREIHLRAGENFVQKPVTAERLLEIVRSCLDN